MAATTCKDFLNHVEAWIGGEHHPDANAHFRNCPACRSLVEDLNAIRNEARSWTAEEAEPSPRVWNSLRLQLEQEGLIHEALKAEPAPATTGWLSAWFRALPRPVLAGGYLAVLIAAAFALSRPIDRRINEARWLEGTQVSTSPLSAQLDTEQNAAYSLRNSDPAVTASLHQNLAIVDNYITLCEKSVREEPQNEMARDYLYEAYQQKADLLAQMTERGEAIQ
jgi:hypothetical protein